MIIIKTDYICLLYLESLDIPDKDKISFFYNVCKCTNISESKMIPLSSIYALYGVFGGKPIATEQLASVNKRHVTKGLDCASLIKRKAFKDLDIEMNACCLCPFSKSYRNARKKHEDIVLRKLVEPTIPFKHSFMLPERSFYSVNRIAADYAIGKYPIIQLNYHLYNCLYESSNKRLAKEELIKDFTNYLLNQEDAINSFYMDKQDELENYISIYINDLFNIRLEDMQNGIYEESYSIVSDVNYHYTPQITNIATSATEISKIESEEVKSLFCDNANNLKIMDDQKKEEDAKDPLSNIPSADEINECISEANIKAIAKDMQIDRSVQFDKNEVNLDFYTNNETFCRHCISCKTNVSNNVYITHTDCIPYNCGLSQRYYKIQGDFVNKIIFFNKETSQQFISDMVRSYYISIECAVMNNRKGFLLYSSYNKHFYFYDIEIEGIDPLIFQFNDPEKIILSFHTLEVYGLMHKYGGCNVKIHDLHALYCIPNSVKVYPLLSIIQDSIGQNNKKQLDFYQFAMPIYQDLFPTLYKPLMENKDKLLEYERTLRLYKVLSSSYNMSDLFSNTVGYIEQEGVRHFKFSFDWSFAFRNPGVLYRISLPNLIVSKQGIDSNSFTMDVCLLFINIPHIHKQRSNIVSIADNEIIIYYEGNSSDSRKFYDILMRGIRKSYAKHYSDELNTATYCVTYSN